MNKSKKSSRKCAVCGNPIEFFEICEVCGWQDDGLDDRDPNKAVGPNHVSFNEAKETYKHKAEMN